jgi:hypothetical protein
MELSAEVLMSGEVVLYARFKDDDPDNETLAMARNIPGPEQPDLVLGQLIEKVWRTRHEAAGGTV